MKHLISVSTRPAAGHCAIISPEHVIARATRQHIFARQDEHSGIIQDVSSILRSEIRQRGQNSAASIGNLNRVIGAADRRKSATNGSIIHARTQIAQINAIGELDPVDRMIEKG